jgi:hypothetical protein
MITAEQLATAFNEAGVDTADKVKALLVIANAQTQRNALTIARDNLLKKAANQQKKIEEERQALTAQIDTLTAQIGAVIPAAPAQAPAA